MNLNNFAKQGNEKKYIIRNKCNSYSIMCFDTVVLETKGVEPVVSPEVNMSSDVKDEDIVGWKSKPGRRSFSRYVKAVLFETSLMKKMRTKKLGQKLYKNCTNGKYSKPKPKSKNYDTFCEAIHSKGSSNSTISPSTTTKNSSSSSTATSSRCSSSSLSWNSSIKSVENNLQKQVEKGLYGSNVGICLPLVSLLVLVIWGKVCAIFCTSTWLFFVCRWSTNKPVASENVAIDRHCFPEVDTEGYKKKIVMEGLLDRDRSRNRFPC